MKAITVRQPWAWAIIHGGKPIENRSQRFKHRGPLAIHAGLKIPSEHEDRMFWHVLGQARPDLDPRATDKQLQFGGFIGIVDVVDCVESSDSPWFFGPYGLVLANPRPVKFLPFKGKLGLFDIPDDLLEVLT